MRLQAAIGALSLAVACALGAPSHGQQNLRPKLPTVEEALPAEIFSLYGGYVHELMLPLGSVPSVNYPFPIKRLRFSAVPFFAFDRFDLSAASTATAERIADALKVDPKIKAIVIVGHTDSIGSPVYNSELSRRRAATVAEILVARGIDAKMISLVPLGQDFPVADNASEAGRAKNRRVEFYLSSLEQAALVGPRTLPAQTKAAAIYQIYGVDGRSKGAIDMSKHVSASERLLRRPLAMPDLPPRRALPGVPGMP